MSKTNGLLIVGVGGAAAYYFWPQIAALLGIPAATAAPSTGSTTAAPALTAAQTAAAAATAAGATPAQAATAGAAAANSTPPASITPPIPPTITADSPDVHNALVAYSTADSPATLARAQAAYGNTAADYILTVSQWNWYLQNAGGTATINGPTSAGDNAISAAQYLALRTAAGLLPAQHA